jgi:hypothetical protein
MRASDIAAVAAVIDPDAYSASTVTSGWVSMSTFRQIMAIVFAGTLGASATVDAKLQQATDSSGTGAKDIAGKAITQLTQAGTDDDKQAVINCRADELDLDNGFDYVRLSITIATAACDAGGVILGMNPGYGGASDNDAATVDEIVA